MRARASAFLDRFVKSDLSTCGSSRVCRCVAVYYLYLVGRYGSRYAGLLAGGPEALAECFLVKVSFLSSSFLFVYYLHPDRSSDDMHAAHPPSF